MTFKELGISPEILKAINELGFENPMPVQAETLPVLLSQDVNLVALAQTGTGKTAAFGLPMIQKMDYSNKSTEVLVLCPTRELCIQIAKDCKNYAKYIDDCSILPVYGGASIDAQIRTLKKGVKMIVATPGRMNDLINRGKVDISELKYVILDEADEMLDMGFKDDLDNILAQTPKGKHTLLFSATMPKEVESIAKNYMDDPVRIQIGTRNQGADNVSHFFYLVQAKDRYLALKRIADYYPNIYSIIFCRTKIETQEVADKLIRDGYNADSLHGDLSQAQRDHVMNRFRCRNIQMLVATDVAARGLDVNDLTHVINYNLPDELEQYVHRSGRTGRADKRGISIAIINLREQHKIREIERQIKKTFTKATIPTGKEVCEKQLFNMIDKVEHVDVNYSEIETFLPDIFKKLEWMDKDELIRKFVSLEFNRFLEYYRDAPDLNVDESKERKREDSRKKEKKSNKGGRFTRLFINVGHRDKIVPQRLIGMINDYTLDRHIEIGKIDILDNFSYIEVGEDKAQKVIEAFEDRFVKGRPIVVELAESKEALQETEETIEEAVQRIEGKMIGKGILVKGEAIGRDINLIKTIEDMILAPSLLSADFGNLKKDIELVNESKADWFHIDVMDGVFVPNISFGQPVIKCIKKYAKKPLDVHLMIIDPDRYFEDFKKVGADILTVHYEACRHLNRSISSIKQLEMKAGVVLNPHTPISVLEDIIQECDMVLLMSVNPGFGGQSFIENTYNKIKELKELIQRKNPSCLIEIDGGVSLKNYKQLISLGADALVAGNAIFGADNPIETINEFKS